MTERCSFCDGKLQKKKVQKPCWWGKELKVIVEEAPAMACAKCGEIYYPIGTLKEIEKLLKKAVRVRAREKKISTARYPG